MRVPIEWLREHVDARASSEEIADRLGIASVEVIGLERLGPPDADGNLDRIRVGRVEEVRAIPERDRIRACEVDVGDSDGPRTIICGAPNVAAGAYVPVALPGARLPGFDEPISERKLAGVKSHGMILSELELGIGTDHGGIIVLEEGADPGAPLVDVLPLGEVLEVEVTGNRPDLLSVYGLAREVATLVGGELRPVDESLPSAAPAERVPIEVEDPADCPRYVGRRFSNVRLGPSPLWMRVRLHASGVRAISNVVDVTNYVMLDLGNPLHAFDADTLAGGIRVRRARAGERLRTLDDTERELGPEVLVIADHERAVAVAGIMGGAATEVTDATTTVLLEAANFDPVVTLRSSRALALRTEGSNRWEKGVDPHLAITAANVATRLLVELGGGEWTADTDWHAELPVPPRVGLRPDRARALIGLDVDDARQRAILEPLGFGVDGDWQVQVPTWRARDVTREVDVIEEVARVELDRIPFELPPRAEMKGRLTREQALMRRVQDLLVGMGLHEAYTPSLSPDDPDPAALRLPDPSTPEQAVLRTLLLTGLVGAARNNLDARNDDVELFELARVYLPTGEQLPAERYHVAGIVQGDFLEVKGIVDALFEALHVEAPFERGSHPLMHPGKTAAVGAGHVGELHPTLLPGQWGAFELDVPTLLADVPERVQFEDVITYPPIDEDLAFVVDTDVPAGELVAAITEAAGPELQSARVFDVYEGPQVGPGRKSVAIAVRYQSPEGTLTDEDAVRLRGRIADALAERFGAVLRAREE